MRLSPAPPAGCRDSQLHRHPSLTSNADTTGYRINRALRAMSLASPCCSSLPSTSTSFKIVLAASGSCIPRYRPAPGPSSSRPRPRVRSPFAIRTTSSRWKGYRLLDLDHPRSGPPTCGSVPKIGADVDSGSSGKFGRGVLIASVSMPWPRLCRSGMGLSGSASR